MVTARFVSKRAVHGVFVVIGAITAIFLIRYVAPGSPLNVMTPPSATAELKQQIATDLGLNQPIYIQYIDYMSNLLTGDLGQSYVNNVSVWNIVKGRLPATIELAVSASVVGIVISIPLGVISAKRQHEPADYSATIFSLLGISTPNFWLGLMLVLGLAVQLNIFPTSGRPLGFLPALSMLFTRFDPNGLTTWVSHMFLPAVTLGTYFTALITRMTRSEMLEELGQDYINVCRAKGLPETLVTFKHALRNSLIPVVTVLGLQIGYLINGSVVTEAVFSWPGMGQLLIDAINSRDWMIIQGVLIFVSIGWVTMNLAVDLLYAKLDPRVTFD